MKAYETLKVIIELSIPEYINLCGAISRVINPPTEETRKRFTDQDRIIFKNIMEVLETVKDESN